MIATLVLAAGSATRFGDDKLVAEVGGRPLLAWTIEFALRAVAAETCFLVVADAAPRGAPAGVAVLVAADADRGMSHSLVSGLSALPSICSGAIVVLGDDPLAVLALPRVHAAAMRAPDAVIAVRRAAPPPHPVYAPRWTWPDLPDGDQGLRALLDGDTVWVDAADLPDPVDVDRPADLARLAPLIGRYAPTKA